MGQRISDLRLAGLPLEADKRYRVAGWAPVAEGATGEPVWDVVERWLRERKVVSPLQPNLPKLVGTAGNPGIS
jgi:sulfur-oxidizing protein SoxB